jgi:hypothetical protein
MVVTIFDNGDVYVKLMAGGLHSNLASIYPDMTDDDITALTAKVWNDNPLLYSPDNYNVGTHITILHTEVPQEPTPNVG